LFFENTFDRTKIIISRIKITPIVPVQTPALKILPITSQPVRNMDAIKITGRIAHVFFYIKSLVNRIIE
jgi:hypothetical protein